MAGCTSLAQNFGMASILIDGSRQPFDITSLTYKTFQPGVVLAQPVQVQVLRDKKWL